MILTGFVERRGERRDKAATELHDAFRKAGSAVRMRVNNCVFAADENCERRDLWRRRGGLKALAFSPRRGLPPLASRVSRGQILDPTVVVR